MTLARITFVRVVAVGMAWFAGNALNASLHATPVTSVGYGLFAIAFLLMAVLTWKSAR